MIFFKKILSFPKSIKIKDKTFNIKVIFKNKKSSSVIFRENEILFRISAILSNSQKMKHFEELLLKIKRKIEISNFKEKVNFSKILIEGYFIFSKEKYLIKFISKRGIKLKGNVFFVNENLTESIIKKGISKILCKKYYNRVKEYLLYKNKETYNYLIKDFELKNLNSKWGHCTYDNKIMLNLKLLNSEIDVLDYVIFHELSHIKFKNHSKFFWFEVKRFCENYKEVRSKLKKNPPQIFNLE